MGLVAFYMLGEGQLWYHQLESEQPTLNWTGFKDYCSLRFGPPVGSNTFGELVNLKHTELVEDY